MKKFKKALMSSILISAVMLGHAQNGWNWGEQIDIAKEKNVIYTDALKAKNYAATIEPLEWLFTNTPDLHVSIYQNGVKIYTALHQAEEDPAKKEEYAQKVMEIFDMRIENFGKEVDVSNRKIISAYRFYSKDKSKYTYLYEQFRKTYDISGNKFFTSNCGLFMNVIYKYRFIGGALTDEEVIELYSGITDILETQKKNTSDEKKLAGIEKVADQVDKILTNTVTLDCAFVEEHLGPKLEETGDENLAKKIFHLLLTGKCLDSPLALKAAEIVQQGEPTYGIAKFMAQKSSADGNDESAISYFEEASNLTDDNVEKAEVFMSIAKIQARKGQKSTARNTARRALSYDPTNSGAYTLIGNMYMSSFETCAGGKSKVDDRAVFIAAYNEFRKAGNTSSMANAKAQFPSIEEIFTEGKEEGQSITIGCWINTTVKLERRPAN